METHPCPINYFWPLVVATLLAGMHLCPNVRGRYPNQPLAAAQRIITSQCSAPFVSVQCLRSTSPSFKSSSLISLHSFVMRHLPRKNTLLINASVADISKALADEIDIKVTFVDPNYGEAWYPGKSEWKLVGRIGSDSFVLLRTFRRGSDLTPFFQRRQHAKSSFAPRIAGSLLPQSPVSTLVQYNFKSSSIFQFTVGVAAFLGCVAAITTVILLLTGSFNSATVFLPLWIGFIASFSGGRAILLQRSAERWYKNLLLQLKNIVEHSEANSA